VPTSEELAQERAHALQADARGVGEGVAGVGETVGETVGEGVSEGGGEGVGVGLRAAQLTRRTAWLNSSVTSRL
jgi:hypothetical protein